MAHLIEWIAARDEYLVLWIVSLAYLTFDFYPQVSSIAAIWSTFSFWMLWAVFTFLDTIAFAILYEKSHQAISQIIFAPLVAKATIQFLSTIGVYSILQSFTLQFAGKKVVDVEDLIARFRGSALQAVSAKKASIERRQAGALAHDLRAIYRADEQALGEDYSQVMSLASMKEERIAFDIGEYHKSAGAERDVQLSKLAMRMARADPESVRAILKKRV
jgi:hypothetical protein